jgi:hypothetical protein
LNFLSPGKKNNDGSIDEKVKYNNENLHSFQMVGHMMYTGPGAWRLAIVVTVVVIVAAASGQEAYFNGTQESVVTSVTFPPTSSQSYHLGFSFRTCGSPSTGTILSQVR